MSDDITFRPAQLGDIRITSSSPSEYRLAQRNVGAGLVRLLLQGGFRWHNVTANQHGIEWRDLPTVDLTDVQRE